MNFDFLTNIIFWDLLLLVIFTVWVIRFISKNKQNMQKEGILYLYKTQVGIKILDKLGKRNKVFWKYLSYLIITIGYLLMIFFTYTLIRSVWMYIRYPILTQLVDSPPIMLLIPYFPRIFGASDLFPPFYFLYFIIAIAVIAIVHEGAHGVYARYHNVRIKSTGFGFLGPILAFFVEQDEKDMEGKKIFPQLSILSAGVFANLVTAAVFFFVLVLLFNSMFIPTGVIINGYATSVIPFSNITNANFSNEVIPINGVNATSFTLDEEKYLVDNGLLGEVDSEYIRVYQDRPAIRANMKGAISSINDVEINNIDELRQELDKYEEGQEINVKTNYEGQELEYNVPLSFDEENNKTVLGIGVGDNPLWFFRLIEPFKENGVAYRAKFWPEFFEFIYYLIGWIVVINALVALFNMLPLGIFDGGRFFYLTILAITKKEKVATYAFAFMTWFLLLLVIAMMVMWVLRKFILG